MLTGVIWKIFRDILYYFYQKIHRKFSDFKSSSKYRFIVGRDITPAPSLFYIPHHHYPPQLKTGIITPTLAHPKNKKVLSKCIYIFCDYVMWEKQMRTEMDTHWKEKLNKVEESLISWTKLNKIKT